MPVIETALILFTSIPTLVLLAVFAQEYLRLRTAPHLAAKPARDDNDPAHPSEHISVLIPARNEAHTIGRCLDGLVQQTFPHYEVIVVDDASTDTTPAILADYAAHHAQVRVVHSTPLPPGWTGKCYACQQAAHAADTHSTWLLFLDADTAPQPALLEALLDYAHRTQADMVTLFPFQELGSFWERLIIPPFLTLVQAVFPFERLNAPDASPDDVMANGQCILVRQDAYHAIGGHGAVRGAVLDDVRLAQTLRAAGFRTVAAMGLHALRVRMYTSGRGLLEGLTKNAVAGFRSGGPRSASAGVRQFALVIAPLLLLAVGGLLLAVRGDVLAWAVLLHGLVVLLAALVVWGARLRHTYALPVGYALLWPVGMLSYGMITVWSLWNIRSGRGVMWKGRTYAGT